MEPLLLEAAKEQLSNISFRAQSAYDITESEVYDSAYSRFLLSHLTEPEEVLVNMVRAVKPGGLAMVEDIDFSGHFCHPERNSLSVARSASGNLLTSRVRANGWPG